MQFDIDCMEHVVTLYHIDHLLFPVTAVMHRCCAECGSAVFEYIDDNSTFVSTRQVHINGHVFVLFGHVSLLLR